MSSELVTIWPALLEGRLASRGLRAARAVVAGAVLLLLAGTTAWGVASWFGLSLEPVSQLALGLTAGSLAAVLHVGLVGAGGLVLWGLVGLIWAAVGGRTLIDLAFGLRTVAVETGGRPGLRSLLRGTVVGVFGLLTVGLAPLLLALVGRDQFGRHWQDRWSGLAVLDVRRGRDVIKRPASPTEIRLALTPEKGARAGIVEVRPDLNAPLPISPSPFAPPVSEASSPPPSPFSAPPLAAPPLVEQTRRASLSVPAVAATEPSTETAWMLHFDTGQSCSLRSTALLGRAPTARAGYSGAELVVVQDPSHTVSGTHAAFGVSEVGVWVCDLGSTNGTAIMTPAGREKVVSPGARVPVPAGGRVRIGDRIVRVQGVGR